MIRKEPLGLLRVAQVIGTFEGGGAQRQAYNLVLGLADLGADAKGVAVRRLGDFVHWSPRQTCFMELQADRERPLTVLRAGWRIRRWMGRWKPHAVHVQGADCLPFLWFALRGMVARPRVFFTWQDSGEVLPQQGRARRRMLSALAGCDAVFGSSRDVAARLAKASGIPNIGVFHGGVPEVPASDPIDPPLIVWVGRVEPAKGPEMLIRAVATLRDRGLSFRVAMLGQAHAGSSYFRELSDLIDRERVRHLIDLPGYVDDDRLAGLLSQASIGVQCSSTEGLSMALLEQMMHGLAIVATDVGDTSVALDGGQCGRLIPRDANGPVLASHLEELIRDPNLRRRLGGLARARALATYSVGAMARRASDIYLPLPGAGAPQPA